jgi:hypothetical protein
VAVTTMKVALQLPRHPTFSDYLARPPAPNIEAVVPLNFSSCLSGNAADEVAMQARAQSQATDAVGHDHKSSRGSDGSSHERPDPFRWGVRHQNSSSGASTTARISGKGEHQGAQDSQKVPSAGAKEARSVEGTVIRTRKEGRGRRVKARLWLANNVAINQRQLLPLLDIMGTQNQYIGKVRSRVSNYP